jgi:SpoVK/Ycf46/Vps4 family AAA+-type ATPase
VKNTGRDSGTAFHDLIAGKGEGSVFLLYGPPGVGKTLTAEATSEVLRRPLYALSMGCMGTTADELERRLSEILKLSAKWDAIILLDEADAFLETRSSSSSLEKNAMVGVMLKLVEYFSGILFLTSNRLDSIDPAFKTRITLALKYDHLDVEAREQIWINLLKSSGVDLTAIDTRALASCFVLNGREIKNALRLALALAAEDGSITPSHSMLMETSAMVGPYQDDDNDKNGKGCFFPWWK